ncbi:MAG: D-glycero-beta-D-manno-heptose-7-phosphate kinase [Elusimicrobiales bacterium]|nr:D-glycero-beta-D-manno-heptose-7-phosphate kinase [Elusimicrobiales bacterium]
MSNTKLKKIIKKFSKIKITVIGETMLDRFIKGSVSRISPEAPVPIVKIKEEKIIPGGAGNVANNLIELGADVSLISLIGLDEAGRKLIAINKERKINISGLIQSKAVKTIEKNRIIAEHQQIVRFDMDPLNFKLSKTMESKLLDALKNDLKNGAKAVIISDYGKGIFTPAMISKTIALCARFKVPVCIDPKVEHFGKYKKVTCITPNTNEAFSGMRQIPKSSQEEIIALGKKIIKKLKLKSLLITQGENGMTLFNNTLKKLRIKHIPTQTKEVFDVTGAGDTVISVFTLSIAAKASFENAAEIANIAGQIVVSKLGTATVNQKEITKQL